jgi:chromatin structure-remodeling complex subunit SFH1
MSSLAPRLRVYGNSVLAPIVQPSNTQLPPASRTTKRGTTVISYAEEFEDDDDFEDGEGRRRPTGLRSTRREDPNQEKTNPADRIGREVTAPVHVQPVWRPWMGAPKIGR